MTGHETPYLRLARECPEHRWWRMPLATLVGIVVYFGFTVVLIVAGMVLTGGMSSEDDGPLLQALESTSLDPRRPEVLGLALVLVALMLPAVLLGRYLLGPRVGDLSSVEGHLRWGWLARCSVLALVAYGGAIGVAIALDADTGSFTLDSTAIWAIVVSVLIIPWQATAEEYVFRGQLMQLVGTWTRWAWVPVVVATPLFVLGHTYDLLGLLDVGVFGLLAAYLVIRTGGLEAAIAAHVANNVVLLCAGGVGLISMTPTSASWLDLIPTIVTSAVMAGGVEVMWRRGHLRRTRDRLPDPTPRRRPAPPPALPVAPYPPTYLPPPPPRPVAAPAPAAIHPDTPAYPGEIDPDWVEPRWSARR